MSDDLFTLPEQPLDPLAEARRRFAAAEAEYRNCRDNEDEHGEPVPGEVVREYRQAASQLQRAEVRELQRRGVTSFTE
jgi:hypothetical protein